MNTTATLDQLGNDLFWTWYHLDFSNDRHMQKISWTGYNDHYWWNKVAPQQNTQSCSCGKKFRIDFETNEVEEITE